MTLFECILVYAVSWWMVLFMVLPWGAHPPVQPGLGHAASAPARPRLKRKLIITSLITLLVPLIGYGVTHARAESGIYHAGSSSKGGASDIYHAKSDDCASAEYQPPADINATGDADLQGGVDSNQFENVPTYLDAPASDYNNNQAAQKFYGGGTVNVGVVSTNTKTGETMLNGQKIGGNAALPEHCK